MRTLSILAMLVVTLSQRAAPATQQSPPSGLGSIEGTVEQANTKTGIADVQISVFFQTRSIFETQSVQEFSAGTQAVAALQTDASGHFELKNLTSGTYIIQAKREGYMAVANQSSVVNSIAISVTEVTADQISKVTLSMARGSTISGRILDSNGNTVPNVTVAAFQKEYQDGRAVLISPVTKQTDDRGEYRLFWLNPGEYYVAVLPGAGGARGARAGLTAGTSVSASRSFYPGVNDAKTATPIRVDEGADLAGISFSMKTGSGGVIVSGRVDNTLPNIVAGARGQPPNLSARQFYLVPLDPTALTLANMAPIQNNAGVGRGGNTDFQIAGVLPGSYDLIALVADDQGRPFPGRTRIDVGNQDMTGVTIPVHPGIEVKGHITVTGNPTDVSMDRLRVLLRPNDGTPPFAVNNALNLGGAARGANVPAGAAPPDPSVFTYSNVPDGRYGFQVAPIPPNAFVEDIREGSRSIYDSGLSIEGGKPVAEIQVVINTNGETVQGTVFDASQKPVSARVVLIPAPYRRQNPGLYKTATSNVMGQFTMLGVAPGDYKLFAWEAVPNGAWQNAEFMTRYEVFGTAVKVAPGIRTDQQLRVIPLEK